MHNNNINGEPQVKDLSFKQATLILRDFVSQRDWGKYHTPRNLVMALMGEVGQLSEIFQWKGEVSNGLPDFSEKQKTHVGEQIADVLCYLIRLADVCHLDIEQVLRRKIEKNKKKYPSQKIISDPNLFLQIKQQRRVVREQGTEIGEKQD